MSFSNDWIQQPTGPGISRRGLLRSGVAVAAGGYITGSAVSTAAAQTDDNWPIQCSDSGNTSYSSETLSLEVEPTILAQADVAAAAHSDYILTQGTAYLHGDGRGVGAVDIQTGELLWEFSQNDQQVIPEGIDGNQLLVRVFDGTLFELDIDTGDINTEIPLEQGYGLGYNGSGLWYAPLSSGRVVAGEVGSTETLWETDVTGVGFRPAEGYDKVFVPTVDADPADVSPADPTAIDAEGRLYALNMSDGTVEWDISRSGGGAGEPVAVNNAVYWPGTDGDILARDVETGEELWTFETAGSFPLSPAVADGVVYAGNQDGSLYVIDADSGDELGRIPAGSAVTTNPVVVDDAVYFGTEDGSVYAAETGGEEQLWQFDAGASVMSLAPSNNAVVAGTEDGYYALGREELAEGGGSTPGQTAQDGTTSDGTATGPNQDATETAGGRQRGLFSNDGDEPAFVSNPFNLTVLGFLLSVVGLVYQLLQGR